MIEIRFLIDDSLGRLMDGLAFYQRGLSHACGKLQFRSRSIEVHADGKRVYSDWSEWQDVPAVTL